MTATLKFLALLERYAICYLRWRHPNGYTIMRTSGEQHMLDNIERFQGTERS